MGGQSSNPNSKKNSAADRNGCVAVCQAIVEFRSGRCSAILSGKRRQNRLRIQTLGIFPTDDRKIQPSSLRKFNYRPRHDQDNHH